MLTERINALSDHLGGHIKDNHGRRGLVLMVNKRNRLLRYLQNADRTRYTALITKLGLRK
jgi:small subunit ribosomal protein S15